MKQTLLAQGAEAKIFKIKSDDNKQNIILKQRLPKPYRHPEIDKMLRQFRTRRESKILEKLQNIKFPAPRLLRGDDKNMEIEMGCINGPILKDILHEKHIEYSREIGKRVAEMHSLGIIHGDLTTSNMILCDKTKQINFIDFGLSKFSQKEEDKAVDLHLLRRALESKHHLIYEECFNSAIEEYKKHCKNAQIILERLEKVEKRGKYRKKCSA